MSNILHDNEKLKSMRQRCTFAIISHPDAGKTTITEKILLYGGAINMAGTIKGRKAARHARSDWMELEKQRGISVTTSVMQFTYGSRVVNLLDTPGHEDFSEDTYRTLTAVDSALMVIDAVKGVESRTIKLMEVCRMRDTPIISFINKLDRDGRDLIELLDEIETTLQLKCVPMTWPIGKGRYFKGIYSFLDNTIRLYQSGKGEQLQHGEVIVGWDNPKLDSAIGSDLAQEFRDELELIRGTSDEFDLEQYLQAKMTPVFFGSALQNFGVQELLDAFATYAPAPQPRKTDLRLVQPEESKFTGFVFKIQANMDPQHRDRIAFMRVCSGQYTQGMKLYQVSSQREVIVGNALTFMAGKRDHTDIAFPGDIIGLHNHGTIKIGDTFTQGEKFTFLGIPNFAPELFRGVRTRDPLKAKALQKGLLQLAEEGAVQVFRPMRDNRIILGAVGDLQFDVVAHRLQHEYAVDCSYEPINITTVRWVYCVDNKKLKDMEQKLSANLAYDSGDYLVYLAPSMVNLNLTRERWPDVEFKATREH